MTHKPITTQDQYDKVAYRIKQLQDAPSGSQLAQELKLLIKLIIEFEAKRKVRP